MKGKSITTDPAKRAEEEYLDNLYKAIALIQQYAEGFSTIRPEDLQTGGISALKQHTAETAEVSSLTPDELFTRQYDNAKKNNPAVSRLEVAQEEEARASILIEELEAIPGVKHYYKTDPRYKKIIKIKTGYLKFLNDILSQKQSEVSTDTFEKLPSQYSKEVLGSIFNKCHSLGLTRPKDKELFISMFTCPEQKQQEDLPRPSGKVFWNGKKKKACAPLYYLIHMITGRKPTAGMLGIYFKSNHTINDNQYPKDKDTGDYPITELSAMIFSVVKTI